MSHLWIASITLAAVVLLYLCSPNQRWLPRPLSARPWRALAWAGLVLTSALWIAHAGIRSGSFIVLTLLMLVLGLLPFLGLLLHRGEKS